MQWNRHLNDVAFQLIGSATGARYFQKVDLVFFRQYQETCSRCVKKNANLVATISMLLLFLSNYQIFGDASPVLIFVFASLCFSVNLEQGTIHAWSRTQNVFTFLVDTLTF